MTATCPHSLHGIIHFLQKNEGMAWLFRFLVVFYDSMKITAVSLQRPICGTLGQLHGVHTVKNTKNRVSVGGYNTNNLRYVDNSTLKANLPEKLQIILTQ